MKLLWIALAAVLLSGCAIVPAPYPYASGPEVSVGVGVPVYRGGYYYGRPYYRRPHYGHYGHYGRPHHRGR